jgi:hypothetical protein
MWKEFHIDGIFRKFEFLKIPSLISSQTRTCARFNSQILPLSGFWQNCVTKNGSQGIVESSDELGLNTGCLVALETRAENTFQHNQLPPPTRTHKQKCKSLHSSITNSGPSAWNLLNATFLLPRILRWLIDFWKIFQPRYSYHFHLGTDL